MKMAALFSEDRRFRWWLSRQWGEGPYCAFIGLNPSTADEDVDDPTIRKCITYARSWEHGGLLMLNLYAWRATKPVELWKRNDRDQDVVGRDGNTLPHMLRYLSEFGATRIVAAWGQGKQRSRGVKIAAGFPRLDCLMRNDDGSPAHPLYLPSGLLPEPWNYTA